MLKEYADACAEYIAGAMDNLAKLPPSRETSLTQTKLDEAMMWLQRATPPINEESRS